MDKNTRNAAFAAAVILLGFGVFAYYLPKMMVALGNTSPIAGFALALLFVVAFFGVFWLRGRMKRNNEEE